MLSALWGLINTRVLNMFCNYAGWIHIISLGLYATHEAMAT